MFSDVIALVPSILFQTYDITSCDASCDHGHMPLHCPRKRKKKKKIKRKEILNQEK